MRRSTLFRSLFMLAAPVAALGPTSLSLAQDAGTAPPALGEPVPAEPVAAPAEPPAQDPAAAEGDRPAAPPPAEEPSAPKPLLEPPAVEPLDLPKPTATPLPEAPKPIEKKSWALPSTMFQLHGYMRMRGTLLKDGALGHTPQFDRLQYDGTDTATDPAGDPVSRGNYDPFPFFTRDDSTSQDGLTAPVNGGCGDGRGNDGGCGKRTQVSGDLRLRLKPEIHLSDDVRVKAWIDVLDNVGLGTMGYGANDVRDLDVKSALRVRRAWGEARNRDIGELRFGRMGADWGLGILDNGGDRNGIDSDFSSDVDRIMAMTNLGGYYLMGAFDWASQGNVTPGSATPSGVPVDRAQKDDLTALTLAAAHRLDESYQQSVLARGSAVFNYGAYFVFRKQLLRATTIADRDATTGVGTESPYTRLNQKQFIPDLWAQFLWEGLRIELEATYVGGSLEGGCPKLVDSTSNISGATEKNDITGTAQGRSAGGTCKFNQLGLALEAEYRLFDDKLGIHFHSGLASGDANGHGLAQTNDPSYQRVGSESSTGDRTVSTYQFHPDYRVDLIMWRTLMRRVAGAYYFKPGVSYDFIHDAFGQRAGGRLDVIYSRATSPAQTWGNSGNLGLEMDLSLYYRSEDGPDPMDGFYGMVQYGILFPFQGLDYASDIRAIGAPGTKNAMILRGVVGIAF